MTWTSKTKSEPRRWRERRAAPARLRTAVAVVALAMLFLDVAGAENSPTDVVNNMSNRALDVLRNQSLSKEEKRAQLEGIVYTNVDFNTLSRLVLARNWRRLSSAQQAEFVEEFKKHLSVTYGDRIDDYKNEHAIILNDREEARGDWTVETKVVRGGPADVAVNYRLRRVDGEWRIIDVIVEGVSLVANFRSQFQEIMTSGGPDRLLRLLREKNASGEPLKS